VSRARNDELGSLKALINLATIAKHQGDLPTARRDLETGLAVAHRLEDSRSTSTILINLGPVCHNMADSDAANRYLSEALAVCRQDGNDADCADVLHNLADVAGDHGDFPKALGYLVECLDLRSKSGDQSQTPMALLLLAVIGTQIGKYESAARLFASAERALDLLGIQLAPDEPTHWEPDMALLRKSLAREQLAEQWRQGGLQTVDESLVFASALAAQWLTEIGAPPQT
jgi:tetratricopeptide (TPR) repeat protein